MIDKDLLGIYEYGGSSRDERIRNIQVERVYLEMYGDTAKDLEYQAEKKSDIGKIIEVYERVK